MPVFETSTGRVNVKNWGYMLQQSGGLNANDIAKEHHDLIVMDFSEDGTGANAFSKAQIDKIKDGPGGRTVAVSYLSIGEASEFRDHWDPAWTTNGKADGNLTASAPDWLGPTNPDWPESRKVRYWDPEWQDIIFNDAKTGWLDKIVAQGFDAAYLDIVDAYYYWAVEVPNAQREAGDPAKNDEKDAAQRMIDFIVDLTAHARETNPDFFVILQNGEFIIDALEGTDNARKSALLDAIGAIAVEDTYFIGGKDENNGLHPDKDKIHVLQHDFLDNGIPVFAVDYLNNQSKQDKFEQLAIGDGFIPYAAPTRELDVMGGQLGGGKATGQNDLLSGNNKANEIAGKGGNDILQGFAGDDRLSGGKGDDDLFGGRGKDKLNGGMGKDALTGGANADRFIFAPDNGRDDVLDFQDGKDKLVLKAFNFSSKTAALKHFYEIGGASNDKVGFDHDGTRIVVNGADLSDIGASDIVI
ncbi:MAG: endo alpha-1,4 polygalactosaminidase [Hyphomicrobiaceae bacterium]|nr:endo alpha-1,4 polygalactosaminidase [Hyphomicrobiaceae bacterium]MCC0024441.1 endo alpha-1,4 polygalactosaminidase [Hyphomicrobiaceae bacterium]